MARLVRFDRAGNVQERGCGNRRATALAAGLCLAAALGSLTGGCALAERVPLHRPAIGQDLPDTHPGAAVANPGALPADRHDLVKSGTGFFVSGDGLLLTSAHVVAGCAAISVWRGDAPGQRGRVVAVDRRQDLALLTTGASVPQFAAALRSWRPSIGERVVTFGFGVDAKRPLAPVRIEGVFVGDATTAHGAPVFVIRAKMPKGTSGSLVLDRNGSLVGMVVGYYTDRPDFGVIVANAGIAAFLAALGVRLSRPSASARPQLGVDHLLRGASALVQCVVLHKDKAAASGSSDHAARPRGR